MIVCCVLIVIILRKAEEPAIAHFIKLLLAVLLANYVVDQKKVLENLLILGEPWMLEGLLGARAVHRIGLYHPHHQVPALW